MAKLTTPKLSKNTIGWNYDDTSENQMEVQEISNETLKDRCGKFKEMLDKLDPEIGEKMVRAANFGIEDVKNLIKESPNMKFLRVYSGIKENGEHMFFMAPADKAGTLLLEDDTPFLDNCCHCPPMGSCPNDPLLEE